MRRRPRQFRIFGPPSPRAVYGGLAVVAVALVVLAAGATLGLWIVNTRILPSALDTTAARLSTHSAFDVRIADGHFVPFEGIELGEILVVGSATGREASTGREAKKDRWELRIESARVRLGIPMLRSLWNLRRAAPDEPARVGLANGGRRVRAALRAERAQDAAWELLDVAVEQALLPRSLTLVGIDAQLPRSGNGSSQSTSLDHFKMDHHPQRDTVELSAARSFSPELTAEGLVNYTKRAATADFSLADMKPADLPIDISALTDGRFGGRFGGRLTVETDTADSYHIEGHIRVDALTVNAPPLASEPVGPMDIDYTFDSAFSPDATPRAALGGPPARTTPPSPSGLLEVHESELVLNGIPLQIKGKLSGFGRLASRDGEPRQNSLSAIPRSVEATITLPKVSTQEIVNATPKALLGPLSTSEVSGTLSWDLSLELWRAAVGEVRWSAETTLSDFEVKRIPPSRNPYKLNDTFFHTITDENMGFTRRIMIPSAKGADADSEADTGAEHAGTAADARADPNYTYVRLEDMSPWVSKAVLSAEDGDFFYHEGVNFTTLPQALERNLRAGEIRYGASTITMQLAKMLFLDHDRVLSRKLQEVILVYLMEHEVPVSKNRILELYLNLAEFGPRIFGIHDAAEHYFGKAPAQLDAGEATWLASILPSPKRYYRYYERGGISEGWFERMESYFDIMLERGRMTEEEYRAAVAEPPTFRKRSQPRDRDN